VRFEYDALYFQLVRHVVLLSSKTAGKLGCCSTI
jgi:hypothetical protein